MTFVLVTEDPDYATGPDGVRRVSRVPSHPEWADPDVTRGIGRVTGEVPAHCPGCRGFTAGWGRECPGTGRP